MNEIAALKKELEKEKELEKPPKLEDVLRVKDQIVRSLFFNTSLEQVEADKRRFTQND